ncbi:MAG: hypothetical protein WDZ40_04275, partial [Candidatus Spechtbacterales bacterium]
MDKVILIKLGELWLKGKNRDDFIDRLVLNIAKTTGVERKNISAKEGRIYVQKTDNRKQITEK